MYAKFFGLQQEPFSIAPDPRYLFMSERHREALAHLLYGLRGGGGFVLLTGEIGAGKTTVCRCFLEQIPERCQVAYIFNPKLTVTELLKTVCEEYHIPLPAADGAETVKRYLDPINEFLLRNHAQGRNNVLIIDEAQNLSAEVLEQLRLLTNLETSERKLLQIILIGQPELRAMVARPELEQLAQRVTARFHLEALSDAETAQYVRHRLGVAGHGGALLFDASACRRIHELSRGVPRRINLLCDRALLGAYARGRRQVDRAMLDKAAAEVFGQGRAPAARRYRLAWGLAALGAGGGLAGAAVLALSLRTPASPGAARAAPAASSVASAASVPQAAASTAAAESVAGITPVWRSEAEAWRALGEVWQLEPGPDEEPCQYFARQQLQCFGSDDGLAQLRLLGRPSVLRLHDEAGQAFYAVLLGLGGQQARVRSGERTQTIGLLTLHRQWRGEFSTLWRIPPGYQQQRIGSGPALSWLDEQLARVFGTAAAGPGPQGYDAALQAKVAAFQRTQGLRSDGLAGPITLMQLNRAAGIAEPRLQTLPADAPAAN